MFCAGLGTAHSHCVASIKFISRRFLCASFLQLPVSIPLSPFVFVLQIIHSSNFSCMLASYLCH
jgi:hypothetical protein